jgi:hypothetical protein
MISKITATYTRHYSDNDQTTTYVEWTDRSGKSGRTEGSATNPHMEALLNRAAREGIQHEHQNW